MTPRGNALRVTGLDALFVRAPHHTTHKPHRRRLGKAENMGHLDRAKARVEAGDGVRASGAIVGSGTGGSAELVHKLAARKARSMFADLMAAGGVGYNQIAKEVLFFIPQDFLDMYEELWQKGLGGKDDGGVGARGAAQAEVGRVGKAATKNKPGHIQVSSGGAKRKTYKKYWVIADEEALAIKDKVDKRLRGLVREVRLELAELSRVRRGEESGSVGGTGGVRIAVRCEGCGRILQVGWKYCPFDGDQIGDE